MKSNIANWYNIQVSIVQCNERCFKLNNNLVNGQAGIALPVIPICYNTYKICFIKTHNTGNCINDKESAINSRRLEVQERSTPFHLRSMWNF